MLVTPRGRADGVAWPRRASLSCQARGLLLAQRHLLRKPHSTGVLLGSARAHACARARVCVWRGVNFLLSVDPTKAETKTDSLHRTPGQQVFHETFAARTEGWIDAGTSQQVSEGPSADRHVTAAHAREELATTGAPLRSLPGAVSKVESPNFFTQRHENGRMALTFFSLLHAHRSDSRGICKEARARGRSCSRREYGDRKVRDLDSKSLALNNIGCDVNEHITVKVSPCACMCVRACVHVCVCAPAWCMRTRVCSCTVCACARVYTRV